MFCSAWACLFFGLHTRLAQELKTKKKAATKKGVLAGAGEAGPEKNEKAERKKISVHRPTRIKIGGQDGRFRTQSYEPDDFVKGTTKGAAAWGSFIPTAYNAQLT